MGFLFLRFPFFYMQSFSRKNIEKPSLLKRVFTRKNITWGTGIIFSVLFLAYLTKKICKNNPEKTPEGDLRNPERHDGMTNLNVAIIEGKKEVVEDYLKNGANPNGLNHVKDRNCEDDQARIDYRPLHYAAEGLDTEIFELLVKHGANKYTANDDGLSPLDILNQNKETLKELIQKSE